MLNCAINNETVRGLDLPPFLTNQPPLKEVGIMAKRSIAQNLKSCKADGCPGGVRITRGLCDKHYGRLLKHGEFNERTRFDPNEIIVKGDIAFIRLYDVNQQLNGTAIIDSGDVGKCSKLKWRKNDNGYVVTGRGSDGYRLHNFVLDREADLMTVSDHINRNPMDCRKVNLRVCSRTENNANVGLRKDNSTGFRGIYKRKERWSASVICKRTIHRAGVFDSKEEAAMAYDIKAKELFGEFAYQNFQ